MTAPKILIVDDDPAERALTSRLAQDALKTSQISTAADAEAALEICTGESFDCIILDYRMPGMDGLACARTLRRLYPYLPIVMSTGAGDEMVAAQAIQHGVTDYIPKSRIAAHSLNRAIQNAMRTMSQARLIDEQRAELEQFAHALAHDFKQPIRQIKTFAALLQGAMKSGAKDNIEQYLAFLTHAASRLGDLVDVMSQYTLLSQKPQIGEIDLNSVFDSVRFGLTAYIGERNGEVKIDAAPTVLGNEALVVQVIQNLVVNGLKYNESATPTVHICAVPKDAQCIITVRDNGIGIEAKYLEEIFKPLARLHTNSEYAGTGLGLTLARKAVGAMGGTILCSSEPGAGSVFTVTLDLPLAHRTESAPAVN